ncbi:MAG: NHL repeat-containing protein [Planctomycetes bacterium]|nr:NHL repeat-containing protein [Planctomycetota bacterium]
MHRTSVKKFLLLTLPCLALALFGCQLSDILSALNDNGAGSTTDGRPLPSDGSGGTGAGGVQHFTVEVVVSPEGSGTVSLDPASGTYEEGTKVKLTAAPSRGFAFVSFGGDATSSAVELTVVVDRNISITAQFEPLLVHVSATIEPSGAGEVVLAPPDGTYLFGTEVTMNAVAHAGYIFQSYMDESNQVLSAEPAFSLVAETDISIRVIFVPVVPKLYDVAVEIQPVGAGSVTLNPPGGTYAPGTTLIVTATANAGFVFEEFDGGNGQVIDTQSMHTFTVEGDTAITARFSSSAEPPPPSPVALAVTATPSGSGTVALDPAGGSYPVGTVVSLQAVPAAGYEFVKYSGDASGTNATTTVTMNTAKSVQAEFAWTPAIGNPGNLLVTGFAGSNVSEFDRFDGTDLGTVIAVGSGTLPVGVDVGPTGDIFVVSFTTNSVIRYEGATGDLIGTFASIPGNFSLFVLRFGPNGDLFVSEPSDDSILEFDGVDGHLVGSFVAAGSGGLDSPIGFAFGPNGNLFVVSQRTNVVLEYNGASGEFVDIFADLGLAGFTAPIDIAFDAAGDAFVASSGNHSVARVDAVTRAISTFVAPGAGGLDLPAGLLIHPDTGSLLVVNQGTDQVLEYDGQTGAFLGVFASGTPGDNLFFMAFRPW